MRQRWMGLEWIDRFGTCVVIGFVTTIVTLATLTACNEDPPPTLPRLPFPSIVNTEPAPTTTILDCGPHIRPAECAAGPGITGDITGVRRSTGYTAASRGIVEP